MAYKVKGKVHFRGSERFDVGSVIEPTSDELLAFPGRFEEMPDEPASRKSASATRKSPSASEGAPDD